MPCLVKETSGGSEQCKIFVYDQTETRAFVPHTFGSFMLLGLTSSDCPERGILQKINWGWDTLRCDTLFKTNLKLNRPVSFFPPVSLKVNLPQERTMSEV